MIKDRPVFGILLMLGFCVIAPLGDSIAKLLGGHISIGQLLFVRFLIQFIVLWPMVALSRRSFAMTRRLYVWLSLRNVCVHGIFFMSSRR